jgi:hypothetical protein
MPREARPKPADRETLLYGKRHPQAPVSHPHPAMRGGGDCWCLLGAVPRVRSPRRCRARRNRRSLRHRPEARKPAARRRDPQPPRKCPRRRRRKRRKRSPNTAGVPAEPTTPAAREHRPASRWARGTQPGAKGAQGTASMRPNRAPGHRRLLLLSRSPLRRKARLAKALDARAPDVRKVPGAEKKVRAGTAGKLKRLRRSPRRAPANPPARRLWTPPV